MLHYYYSGFPGGGCGSGRGLYRCGDLDAVKLENVPGIKYWKFPTKHF
jgi:hypothetical protein